MIKHKLINLKTKEEHLCDVVEKDGYKIYVSENPPSCTCGICEGGRVMIATDNPALPLPQVVGYEVQQPITLYYK